MSFAADNKPSMQLCAGQVMTWRFPAVWCSDCITVVFRGCAVNTRFIQGQDATV